MCNLVECILEYKKGAIVPSHIILLPKTDYWSWVRACKDFVLEFGASMTRDPVTAVRPMTPRQVVTVVDGWDAYPEYGDILNWIGSQNAELRIDAIEAMTPGDLKQALGSRVELKDRFGQGEFEIKLAWPTEFPIITQSFGANPQIYMEYGFPGHEGVDFWALMGSKVYNCMEGEVYRVHEGGYGHPYGIHVGILHPGGYRTIYAHLMKSIVVLGQKVSAGEVIGYADATGSSGGNHLHLVLKHDGATERKETNYPKDVLDPTPFLVWPDQTIQKSMQMIEWTAGKCLIGGHGRIGGVLTKEDLGVVEEARLEAVKISMRESKETIEQLRAINPGMLLVARIEGTSWSEPIQPEEFLKSIESDLGRIYRLGVRHFEILSNPNLFSKGWSRCWKDGKEFGNWFSKLSSKLSESFPEAKLGFPGLSPGEDLVGLRMGADLFLEGAAAFAAKADWIGVNCHWTDANGLHSRNGGLLYEEYRRRFPDNLLMITEFSNPAIDVPASEKARQYHDFLQLLRNRKGIGAAFGFAISAESGYETIVWRNGNHRDAIIPKIIGARKF
jgi:murein DD-endopeptidase MepM/ murein hydrolase activator NlpD